MGADSSDNSTAIPADVSEFSDLGNAYRLRLLHGQDLKFCKALSWLVYDGARFAQDETGQAERRAHDLGRELLKEVADLGGEDLAHHPILDEVRQALRRREGAPDGRGLLLGGAGPAQGSEVG